MEQFSCILRRLGSMGIVLPCVLKLVLVFILCWTWLNHKKNYERLVRKTPYLPVVIIADLIAAGLQSG